MTKTVYWEVVQVLEKHAIVRFWKKPGASDALQVKLEKSDNEKVLRDHIEEVTGLKSFRLQYWEGNK